MINPIQLGNEIKDVTSGATGIAIARVEYLNGSICYLLQPACIDDSNKVPPIEVDDAYAVKIGDGVNVEPSLPIGFHARSVGGAG